MALNFPNSPTTGQVYTDTTSGFSYEWDGTVWKSYSPASASNIKIIDDLQTSFNGSTQTFALTSSGVALLPANAQSLLISIGGVVQEPGTDYTVSTTNITFTTAPTADLSFSGVSLGPAVPVTTIVDGATTDGAFNVVGVLSAAHLRVTGVSTFSGISTFQSSVFGTSLSLTGVATASSFVGSLTGTATGLSGTPNITVGSVTSGNINSSGVVTATSAVVGSAVTINASGVNVSGIVTATSFTGNGAGLTGLNIPAGYTELDGMLFG